MRSIQTLERRVHALRRQIDVKRSWAFILIDDSPIPHDALAKIRPGDPVYVKRIVTRAQ